MHLENTAQYTLLKRLSPTEDGEESWAFFNQEFLQTPPRLSDAIGPNHTRAEVTLYHQVIPNDQMQFAKNTPYPLPTPPIVFGTGSVSVSNRIS